MIKCKMAAVSHIVMILNYFFSDYWKIKFSFNREENE